MRVVTPSAAPWGKIAQTRWIVNALSVAQVPHSNAWRHNTLWISCHTDSWNREKIAYVGIPRLALLLLGRRYPQTTINLERSAQLRTILSPCLFSQRVADPLPALSVSSQNKKVHMQKTYNSLSLAVVVGLAVAAFCSISQAQNQASLEALKDNTLYESATGSVSNGAGQAFFVGRTGQLAGSIRRGLMAFAVAGTVPPGSTVLSVTLTLHMSRTGIAAPALAVELHRALAEWGEGTSDAAGNEGSGAPAGTNDATWLHRFFDTATWTTAGGDYAPQSSASQSVNGVGFYTWESTSLLVNDVQQWINDPASNFGWVILGDETIGSTSKRFDTRENIDLSVRPRLTIAYQSAPASVEQPGLTPATYALYQNYPNPFNPTTVVRYQVPALIGAERPGVSGQSSGAGTQGSAVKLAVYDMLGREVALLVNEQKEPGSYAVTWNASGMASGVYLYRIQSGDVVQTKQMVLMK
jgi:hypothetical protein